MLSELTGHDEHNCSTSGDNFSACIYPERWRSDLEIIHRAGYSVVVVAALSDDLFSFGSFDLSQRRLIGRKEINIGLAGNISFTWNYYT